MANHSSPAHSDGQPVSMIPLVDSSFEADDDHQSRSSHHSISPQTRDVPTIDSEYDLGYISTWRAGLIAANGVDRALAQKLTTFAAKSIGAAGRETVERSRSLIVFGDEVRHRSLPQVDAWLGANK